MTKLIPALGVLLMSLLPLHALASSPINVTEGVKLNLGDQLEYVVDRSGSLSIDDVMSLGDEAWTKTFQKIPNFGYTQDSHWFRFTLNNVGLIYLEALLAVDYPLLDHIEIYHYENGVQIKKAVVGDTYPFNYRPIDHRNFLIPISLFQDVPADFYIKLRTEGSVQLPLAVYDKHEYYLIDQDEQVIKSIYYGMMIVMALYNLFLYFSIRERPYLYYVGFISSLVMLMASAHGFFFQYVIPDSPKIHEMTILVGVPSAMLFACLFASSFLRLHIIAPRLNSVMRLFIGIFALSVIGAFFLPYALSTRLSVFLAIPACIIVMISGPYAWRMGEESARYFTYAWIVLLIGMVSGAMSKFGFIPRNTFTEYGVNLGSAIEALLLSFALADRLNRERNEKFRAQKDRLIEAEQRQEAEDKLYYQATHQSVDGLPNMVLLQQLMHELLHSEDKSLNQFTLVFFHLRHFHEINKTLGHANADLILSLFSQRLCKLPIDPNASLVIEETERNTYYFSHIEGVVFAHILRTGNCKDAELTIKGMRNALAEPIEFNGMRLDLGLSIGIASYPIHGSDIATLIRHTRVAIDAADNANQYLGIYSTDINPYSARRLALMGELKKAINENTLALHFQPLVDCQSGKAIGCEALLRWNHVKLGFIPPDEFIGLAEKTGIMRPLTQWVLEHAIIELSQLRAERPSFLMSLNISAINLQEKDFAAKLISLLNEYHIPAENIVLEVTETSVMSDPESAVAMLTTLAENNFKIAIDDFGTGHSSLSYIRQLPVYEVKIDRSFIAAMDQTSDDAIIAKTALNLSHDLGYKVVAEGVESQSVYNSLQSMGCDYIQGYHIARPMPADDFHQWLEQNQQTESSSANAG